MAPILRRRLRVASILLVLATLLWLAMVLALRQLPSPAPTALPLAPTCLQALVAGLAQGGLEGKAGDRGGGALVVEALPPDHWPEEWAPQAIWVVFDAAASLPAECSYRELTVVVPTERERLLARVSADDLRAWAEAVLDDETLLERVYYVRQSASPY